MSTLQTRGKNLSVSAVGYLHFLVRLMPSFFSKNRFLNTIMSEQNVKKCIEKSGYFRPFL